MPATTPSTLDRLGTLSHQRTVRTNRLYESVRLLLSQLEAYIEVGESVTVAGYTLKYTRLYSNVGHSDLWAFYDSQDDEDGCDCYLNRPVGSNGYLHNDFHCAISGPTRSDLLTFARYSKAFVDAFIGLLTHQTKSLDAGQTEVERAIEQIAQAPTP
jgi:hypothetical protein